MAHQIMLPDEDYEALVVAATERNQTVERLLHDMLLSQGLSTAPRQLGAYSSPTHASISQEEREENERIAASIGDEHPRLSEMIIEDRGPR